MQEKNIILLISGFSLCSNFYIYDIPSALNYKLDFKTSLSVESWIGILYMCYSIPNIVFPVIFSYSLRTPSPKMITFLSFLIFLGQFIFTAAIWSKRFELAIIGRIVLGIGSETCSIMQNKVLSDYFKSDGMVSALTFYNCAGQMGTVLNFFITPKLAEIISPFGACSFGCILALLAFFSSFKKHSTAQNNNEMAKGIQEHEESIIKDNSSIEDNKNAENSFEIAIADDPMNDNKNHIKDELDCLASNVENSKNSFNSSFKIITAICFLYGLSSYPFFNVAPMMYQTRFKMDSHKSSHMVSYIEIISITFSFLIAFLADKYGHILSFSIFGTFLLLLSHISTVVFKKHSFISVVLMGLSIPMASCFWFCVPRLVSEKIYHMRLSVLTCANNISYTVSPLITSTILSKDSSFLGVELYFISIAILSLFFLSLLVFNNITKKLRLNSAK